MGLTDLISRFETRTRKVASRSATAKVNSSTVLQATATPARPRLRDLISALRA
jgi:hypothetical protein